MDWESIIAWLSLAAIVAVILSYPVQDWAKRMLAEKEKRPMPNTNPPPVSPKASENMAGYLHALGQEVFAVSENGVMKLTPVDDYVFADQPGYIHITTTGANKVLEFMTRRAS